MKKGYKWTGRKSDGKLFIVTLICNNEYIDPSGNDPVSPGEEPAFSDSFFTTDCRVEAIEDENGNRVNMVDGAAYYPFKYHVGQEIKERKIYYYHDKGKCLRYGKPAIKYREALKKWLKAGERASFLLFDRDMFTKLRAFYFFEMGGTLEDLSILKGAQYGKNGSNKGAKG